MQLHRETGHMTEDTERLETIFAALEMRTTELRSFIHHIDL